MSSALTKRCVTLSQISLKFVHLTQLQSICNDWFSVVLGIFNWNFKRQLNPIPVYIIYYLLCKRIRRVSVFSLWRNIAVILPIFLEQLQNYSLLEKMVWGTLFELVQLTVREFLSIFFMESMHECLTTCGFTGAISVENFRKVLEKVPGRIPGVVVGGITGGFLMTSLEESHKINKYLAFSWRKS